MDKNLANVNTTLFPIFLISVYSDGRRYNSNSYIEYHEINEKNGQILEGRPMPEKVIREFIDTAEKAMKLDIHISGEIPSTLYYFDKYGQNISMVWSVPPGKRLLLFDKNLNIPNLIYPLPGLIFRVLGNTMDVYSYVELEGKKTILYRAPFHNVSSNGDICLGTAKRKIGKNTYHGFMQSWEDIFFKTTFTHLMNGGSPTKSNLNVIYRDLANGKRTEFPMDQLVSTKFNLESLWKNLKTNIDDEEFAGFEDTQD